MDSLDFDKKDGSNKDWKPALFLFVKISGWIAFPVILSLLLGKFLDKKFGTDPIIFLSLTGESFVVSVFGIIKETRKVIEQIEKNGTRD